MKVKKASICTALLCLLFLAGCSTTYPNRNPIGEMFPSVIGESLNKEAFRLPEDLPNETVILLLGYVQDAQFDIDRWLIGLDMRQSKLPAYEIPTIQGMFPRMFETQINNGMRRGIPKELWGGVITVYKQGAEIQKLTGNENPNNARVLVLDDEGKIIYFYDRGFSVAALNEVLATAN